MTASLIDAENFLGINFAEPHLSNSPLSLCMIGNDILRLLTSD